MLAFVHPFSTKSGTCSRGFGPPQVAEILIARGDSVERRGISPRSLRAAAAASDYASFSFPSVSTTEVWICRSGTPQYLRSSLSFVASSTSLNPCFW